MAEGGHPRAAAGCGCDARLLHLLAGLWRTSFGGGSHQADAALAVELQEAYTRPQAKEAVVGAPAADESREAIPESAIFQSMRNSLLYGISSSSDVPTERALLTAVLVFMRACLPGSWEVGERTEPLGTSHADAHWVIRGPDGTNANLLVEVKPRIEPRHISTLVSRAQPGGSDAQLLVISSFLSSRSKHLLEAADVSYADATGNFRLHLETPAVFVQTEGAATDPWRSDRPVLSLKGPASGRVVRALCDFQPPYRSIDLATRSQIPPSSVSRVIQLLEREALLTREQRGAVIQVQVPELIRRWTQDYGLARSNTISALLEPRGLQALVKKLRDAGMHHAVTGSLAAETVMPHAAARLGVVYVRDSAQAAQRLNLHAVDAGTNVLLVEPFDPVVFERTSSLGGVTYAAFSQVAADLLTSPGRGPAEGEKLLQWMETHERDWRQ